jgi:hypothetical protein
MCSVSYEPIAGHRANIPLVKYLSEGREIEIALAPIAGTRLLAPFRLSVASTLANLMIGPIDLNDYGTCSSRPTGRDGGEERCVQVRGGIVVCQKVPGAAAKQR